MTTDLAFVPKSRNLNIFHIVVRPIIVQYGTTLGYLMRKKLKTLISQGRMSGPKAALLAKSLFYLNQDPYARTAKAGPFMYMKRSAI